MIEEENRDVAKNSPAHVYVLPKHVNDRPTVAPHDNACRKILEQNYDELPWAVLEQFDAYLASQNITCVRCNRLRDQGSNRHRVQRHRWWTVRSEQGHTDHPTRRETHNH